VIDRPLSPVRREHLEALTGPLGIWQHAAGRVPDQSFGYCTDDVARALAVDLLQGRTLGWEAVRTSTWRSMGFLRAAFRADTAGFRNFRDADGTWLDEVASDDSQGRALLALGTAVRDAPDDVMRREAGSLLAAALPGARRLTALRAVASALLGCDAALHGGLGGDTAATFAHLAGRLRLAFAGADLDGEWPWPEPVLTYENALLPRAMIVAGVRLADPSLLDAGLRVLDWLTRVQASPEGWFSPIGNEGWWPRGGTRARFDQQPIEATAMILAAHAALEATGDGRHRRLAEIAYAWFLGSNDAGLVVADVPTGGCHDGLAADEVNGNMGAESTLMWLTAVELLREMRVPPVRAEVRRAGGVTQQLVGARP